MQEYIDKANVLIEALPYMREFQGKTVVIKYGGAAMIDPALRRSVAQDIVLMKYVGIQPVVVHGGGPEITKMLDRLALKSLFNQGLRVTDDAAMEVVEMVLVGRVNKEIVSLLNHSGADAVGLSGKDGNLLLANRMVLDDGSDLGHVGEVSGVHQNVVDVLCKAGFVPVVAPVATDVEGGTWNVNADSVAGEVAAALHAEKLVFLTDMPGLLRDKDNPESLIRQVRSGDVYDMRREGVIAGGMIPKIEACLKALDAGVRKTHVIDGRISHSLLIELFTNRGLGTLVSH
ncbi:MAG: acetylglutamate kinase [Candidatus Hydrogenedentota bacterium]